MSSSKLNDLCAYLAHHREKNYPIGNGSLQQLPEHQAQGYLKILAAILQQGRLAETQICFFKRLLYGVNSSLQMEEVMRQALNVEIEDYNELVEVFKDSPLRFRMVFDALILLGLEEKVEEQINMLSFFIEALQITLFELNFLIDLARCVLSQDETEYLRLRENYPLRFEPIHFLEYIELFVKGVILNDARYYIAIGDRDQETEIDYSAGLTIESERVLIRNIAFKSTDKGASIAFRNCKRVEVRDSKFFGGRGSNMVQGCEKIEFVHCEFFGYQNHTIHCFDFSDMEFRHCRFEHCLKMISESDKDWRPLGGVLFMENPERFLDHPILIRSCVFKECGGRNARYYFRSCIISNARSSVKESRFLSCWHYNLSFGNYVIDPEDRRRTLFTDNSTNENNEFVNSADFN